MARKNQAPPEIHPQRHEMGALYHDNHPRHYHNHCFYCGRQVNKPPKGRLHQSTRMKVHYRTVDHVEPRILGHTRRNNTVIACLGCNNRKSALCLNDWRIVFFGGHGGEFYGEKIERMLKDGIIPSELKGQYERL